MKTALFAALCLLPGIAGAAATPDYGFFSQPDKLCHVLDGEGIPKGKRQPILDTNLTSCGGSLDIGGPVPNTPGFPTRILFETISTGDPSPVSDAKLELDVRNPASLAKAQAKYAGMFAALLKSLDIPYTSELHKAFEAKANAAIKTDFGHIVFVRNADDSDDRSIHLLRQGERSGDIPDALLPKE